MASSQFSVNRLGKSSQGTIGIFGLFSVPQVLMFHVQLLFLQAGSPRGSFGVDILTYDAVRGV